MPNHFIHYLTRRVVMQARPARQKPWFAQVQQGWRGFHQPAYHITRATAGPPARVQPGDVIWLVARLQCGQTWLPPALDAKMIISSKEKLPEGGFKYMAGPGSQWFPLADATGILDMLTAFTSINQQAPLWPNRARPIGNYLRVIRQLESAAVLNTWCQQIANAPYHFISYRQKDGTRQAFAKAGELMAAGQVVYWDRWSLPRRLTERREAVDDGALDDYLLGKIRAATVCWGIETAGYFDMKSYAYRERALALEVGNYRPALYPTLAALRIHQKD